MDLAMNRISKMSLRRPVENQWYTRNRHRPLEYGGFFFYAHTCTVPIRIGIPLCTNRKKIVYTGLIFTEYLVITSVIVVRHVAGYKLHFYY